MCDEAGVLLEYLPPYSPDLRFAILKAWIRRNDLSETFAFGERSSEGTGDQRSGTMSSAELGPESTDDEV